MRLTLCLLALAALTYARPDANELMQRAVDADMHNDQLVRQYTWRTNRAFWRVDKNGNKSKLATQTFDMTRIGEHTDKRLIERDGRILTKPSRKDEQLDAGISLNLAVTIPIIQPLFDFTYLREEVFRGRRCWVLLATPKANAVAKSGNDRELLRYRVTVWLDEETAETPHGVMEVIADKAQLEKGSTLEWISEPNDEGAWLVREVHIIYTAKGLSRGEHGEWHDTMTAYRKFDASSRIVGIEPER